MIFESPDYVGNINGGVPDNVPIHEFLFGEGDKYGRFPKAKSHSPFVCGASGKEYTTEEVEERIESLARALASELGFDVNEGSEMDKVIGVFTLNAVRIGTHCAGKVEIADKSLRLTPLPSPGPPTASTASRPRSAPHTPSPSSHGNSR